MILFKYRYVLGIFLAFGALGFAGVYAWESSSNDAVKRLDSHGTGTVAPADFYIDLESGRANPDTITVPLGKTVQFNSKDGKEHNISVGGGGEEHEHTGSFHSGVFGKNEAWRATFNKPGTYIFHDHNNPHINILIVVYQPSSR